MDLKEIEDKIRAEQPEFASLIDGWPEVVSDEIISIWHFVSIAYDLGYKKGMTHSLEQHAKIMNFAMGKILGKQAGR
mgnify:CR=1 FL=1